MRKFLLIAAALAFASAANAADLPKKAPTLASPFLPTSVGGWYIGIGTSAGVADGSTSGSNLLAPNLVSGNLVADGASVDVVGGYIRNGGPLNTWWRFQVGASYQNISGGTVSGSINSRWRLDQEADIGADIVQSVLSAIGNVGNLSSTFSALGNFAPALPANVTTVGTPRQYVGVVLEESLIGGSAFGATGQSWIVAPGVKTGWIWELPGTNGQPNGNALEVNAQVTWPTQGASFSNVLAANGSPIVIGPAIKEGANYRAGIVYHFGL